MLILQEIVQCRGSTITQLLVLCSCLVGLQTASTHGRYLLALTGTTDTATSPHRLQGENSIQTDLNE